MKDGPRKRNNRKGRGESEEEERNREKRCATIADLLVAGKTGRELATAMEVYDGDPGRGRTDHAIAASNAQKGNGRSPGRVPTGPIAPTLVNMATEDVGSPLRSPECLEEVKPLIGDDSRFDVSLTAMFKRSSSAPAPHVRGDPSQFHRASQSPVPIRRDSFSATPSSFAGMQHVSRLHGAAGGHEATTRSEFKMESLADTSYAVSDSVSSMQSFVPGLPEPHFPLQRTGII